MVVSSCVFMESLHHFLTFYVNVKDVWSGNEKECSGLTIWFYPLLFILLIPTLFLLILLFCPLP